MSDKIILNKNFKDKAVKLTKMRIGYIEDLYPDILDIRLTKSFIIINRNGYEEYLNVPMEINRLRYNL